MKRNRKYPDFAKLLQKWHCNPELLTAEEWEIIPKVREWEHSITFNYTKKIETMPSFEKLFTIIYKINPGLEP